MNKKTVRALIEAAKRARLKAYCPYSRYPIGAAVLTDSGRIFPGANVENASYGLTICGERTAVANAVTHGEKSLTAVCVVGKSPRPCGACRQFMIEFSTKDTWLYIVDLGGDGRRESVNRTRVFAMLPGAFDPLEAGLLPRNPTNLLKRRSRKGAKRRARPARR
ncbi:MAG: cytidine deaminase [Elusimicrobia bacterium]|nr:cytidine deaminase [Elusimicrobiota bacterium]